MKVSWQRRDKTALTGRPGGPAGPRGPVPPDIPWNATRCMSSMRTDGQVNESHGGGVDRVRLTESPLDPKDP